MDFGFRSGRNGGTGARRHVGACYHLEKKYFFPPNYLNQPICLKSTRRHGERTRADVPGFGLHSMSELGRFFSLGYRHVVGFCGRSHLINRRHIARNELKSVRPICHALAHKRGEVKRLPWILGLYRKHDIESLPQQISQFCQQYNLRGVSFVEVIPTLVNGAESSAGGYQQLELFTEGSVAGLPPHANTPGVHISLVGDGYEGKNRGCQR